MFADLLLSLLLFSELVQAETVFACRKTAQLPATFALCVRETQHHLCGGESPGAPTWGAALWK